MKIPDCPPNLPLKKIKAKIVEYFDRDDVQEMIKYANERYFYWDEFKYRPQPEGTDPRILWSLIKWARNSDINYLTISNVDGFSFKYKVLDNVQQKLHEFDLHFGGNLKGGFIPEEDKEKILINSIMEEAIASSQLEGAATTRKIAKDMLRTERKPKNKSEKMILNNYLTMNKIKDCLESELTPELLLEIHTSMTKGTLDNPEHEGSFRQSNEINVVDKVTGRIFYTPPKYELIPKLVKDFCHFANTDSEKFMHPIIKATMLHFLIGYIHPFADGNGRTARAISYWYLMSKGYWSFEFLSISRIIIKSPSKYAKAYLFTEKDENDLTYFINYQIRTMELAFNDLMLYIQKKIEERESLHEFLNIQGINKRQKLILKLYQKNPRKILSIAEIENTYGVVYQTARTDLLGLVELKLIDKKISGKKKFAFVRSKDFDNKLAKLMG